MPTIRELLPLPGYEKSIGEDIDDKGRVIGYSSRSSGSPLSAATVWIDAAPYPLFTSPSSWSAYPYWLNNAGDCIVSESTPSSTDGNYFLAKVSTSPSVVPLESVVPGVQEVYGLNDKRQLLCYVDGKGYVVQDLDGGASVSVPEAATGTHNNGFLGIDNAGRIAGIVLSPGQTWFRLKWQKAGDPTWVDTGIDCSTSITFLTRSGLVLSEQAPETPADWGTRFWYDLAATTPTLHPLSSFVPGQPTGVIAWGANRHHVIVGGASNGVEEVPFRCLESGALEDLSVHFSGVPKPLRALDVNDAGTVLVQGYASADATLPRAWLLEGLAPLRRVGDVEVRPDRAIDPLYLLLPTSVYVALNKPYPPPIPLFDALPGILRALTPEQAARTLARVDLVRAYTNVIERELAGVAATTRRRGA